MIQGEEVEEAAEVQEGEEAISRKSSRHGPGSVTPPTLHFRHFLHFLHFLPLLPFPFFP